MKYIYFIGVFFISGCFSFINEKFVTEKPISNGITIKLYHSGGGTVTDIIWVKKVNKYGRVTVIGKIKGYTDIDAMDINEIDSNHISVSPRYERDFFEKPIIFVIDLNNKIKQSAESPFNERM